MDTLLLALLGVLLSALSTLIGQAYAHATRAWAELVHRRTRPATVALELLRYPDWYRHAPWAGRVLGSLLYGWALWGAIEPLIGRAWPGVPEPYRTLLIGLGGAFLLGIPYYVLAWWLPDLVGRYRADRLVLPLAYLARVLAYLVYPLTRALGQEAGQGGDRQGVQPGAPEERQSEVFPERVWLERALQLTEQRVKDLMIPRTEIEAVEENSSLREVIDRFRKTGYWRLPVYQGTIDTVIGLVQVQDLFRRPTHLREILRPVLFVPESKTATNMLLEFRRTGQVMAIVLDEYGGTAGLITLDDLLEELLEDIERYEEEDELVMRRLNPHTFILSGRASIEEINDRFGLGLPEGDYETLAGYIMDRLGLIPAVNEEFVLDGRFRVIITRATPSRIDLVKLIVLDAEGRRIAPVRS
jgi:putative hemolysin|nr:MAG: hypothetical protein KatS3mg041_1690 [Bacteroidota bacterium]